jgi:hypothetical protein
MDTFQCFELSFFLIIIGLVLILYVEITNLKKQLSETPEKPNEDGNRLKLQALERLTLFAERSALKNLISRVDSSNMSAPELHHFLIETLKAEYDYNMSQQIYVSPEVWNAVARMKDQNIYIINHITANLSPQASGKDLSKFIIEYSMTPNAEMNALLLDALQFEAKKFLN